MREILDAVFYAVRGGCAWRLLLPHDFPPWKTVYHYFRAWRIDCTWRRPHEEALRRRARVVRLERDPQPSAGIVDSQSAKTTGVGGRGGARLRPRQEGPGPQAAPAGGHRRAGDEGEGPLGRRLRPGRHQQAADGARDGALPAALASVAGRRIQRQGEGGKDWAEEALGLTVEEVVRPPPRRWVWVPADREPPPRPAFTVLARRGGWWRERSRGWDRTAG